MTQARISFFALSALLLAAGCSLPVIKPDKLKPRPMKVALVDYHFNAQLLPFADVDEQFRAFRESLVQATADRFAFLDQDALLANPTYRQIANDSANTLGGLIRTELAWPKGMMIYGGQPSDKVVATLCDALGVDAILWVDNKLSLAAEFAVGGLGSYHLKWDTRLDLIARDGDVWFDIIGLKSNKTFPAVNGIADPAGAKEAAGELSPQLVPMLVKRFEDKLKAG